MKCASGARRGSRTRGGRYAKLAISLESNCDSVGTTKLDSISSTVGSQVVEVSDKATETTPSLCQYGDDDEEGYSLENSLLEDYYDPADLDQLQCYENEFSDSYDEEEEGKEPCNAPANPFKILLKMLYGAMLFSQVRTYIEKIRARLKRAFFKKIFSDNSVNFK